MGPNKDDEPIMVVLNADGLVVFAGQPRKPTAAEWREWSQPSWNVTTIKFKEYKDAKFTWVFDKK